MTTSRTRTSRAGRLLRGVSGVLAAGLVGVAVILLAGWAVTTRTGTAGPGTGMLLGHGAAAVVAVVAQAVADRRRDRTGVLAAWAAIVLVAAVVAWYWLF
ncbi:hypothetical protein [Pseudonocardia sp. T1-2H]|uniref:hypothetical protein n=1 Tax=Pseudonocardia sp. T1-2H TaxID=3128899 RepID=UPI003100FB44